MYVRRVCMLRLGVYVSETCMYPLILFIWERIGQNHIYTVHIR